MLELHKINAYYGQAHIVHSLFLKVHIGEAVALVGRNGAGKSTVFKTIMGLIEQKGGRVIFKDTDISSWPTYKRSQLGLGYVPEDRRIFPDLTVLENLAVGQKRTKEQSHQSPINSEIIWNPDRIFALFPNLSERQNNKAGLLSGGEQQMLSLARTLMGNPQFLLLDEPSEGISPKLVQAMIKVILNLKEQGLTLLISEQNQTFVSALCDRTYHIQGGHIQDDTSIS